MKAAGLSRIKIQELAAQLCGTCRSLSDAQLNELGLKEDSIDLTIRLEQEGEIFLCDTCGWWCEVSEMSEGHCGQICIECYEEKL